MTVATFETATLADAVLKASRFAPTKGSALDRSAGIIISIEPGDHPTALVRSTDLLAFFRQTLAPMSARGTAATWRAPSRLLASFLAQLPMHMGSTTTLGDRDNDGCLYIKCGGIKGQIRLINASLPYPEWEPFEIEGMGVIEHLSDRLMQVGWCTEQKGSDVLTGIHIDGEYLSATNRNEAVRVPLVCPVTQPITAPLQSIQALVKDHPEVRVRVGTRLELATDDDTQVELLLFEGNYPAIAPLLGRDLPEQIILRRQPVMDAIDRLLVIVQGERYPQMQVEFEPEGLLRLTIDEPDVGRLIEEIEIPPTKPFNFVCTPGVLRHLLGSARSPEVRFDHSGDPFGQLKISDENGYIASAMARRPT